MILGIEATDLMSFSANVAHPRVMDDLMLMTVYLFHNLGVSVTLALLYPYYLGPLLLFGGLVWLLGLALKRGSILSFVDCLLLIIPFFFWLELIFVVPLNKPPLNTLELSYLAIIAALSLVPRLWHMSSERTVMAVFGAICTACAVLATWVLMPPLTM